MWYLYFIKSFESGIVHVGIAQDLDRSLKEHNAGKNRTTKVNLPWELIYSEGPFELNEAKEKEKYFKKTPNKKKVLNSL